MEVATFTCSICGETSHHICVYCTKDTCGNHLCERCRRCSDCCQCEVSLIEEHVNHASINGHVRMEAAAPEAEVAADFDVSEFDKETGEESFEDESEFDEAETELQPGDEPS